MTPAPPNPFDLIVVGDGPGSRAAVGRAAKWGLRTAWVAQAAVPGAQVTAFPERGKLSGPGQVALASDQAGLTAPAIILAVAGLPATLAGIDPGLPCVLMDDPSDPVAYGPSLLVVGGGPTGVAAAWTAASGGREVHLIVREEGILADQDPDCVALIAASLAKAGVFIHTGARLREVTCSPTAVTGVLSRRGTTDRVPLQATALRLAVGRRPVPAGLGLETVAVVQDRRGFLQVDSAMQTPQAGLYAVGDLVPTPTQAHVAVSEALAAVDHAVGRDPAPLRYSRIPTFLATDPGLAAVGLTAAEAEAAGHLVATIKVDPEPAVTGLARLVQDRETGQILGLHVAGPDAAARLIALAALNRFPLDLAAAAGPDRAVGGGA